MRKRRPTIFWEPASITYGMPLGPRQLNAKAIHRDRKVLGSFEYSPARGSRLPAGKHTVTVIWTPKDTRYFDTVKTTVKVECKKATLTASIVGTPTKVYDGTSSANLTSDSFKLSGLKGEDSFTVTATDATYDSPNAGTTNSVTATLTDASFVPSSGTTSGENYNFPATAKGKGQISPVALTVSIINCPTKTYDGTRNATLTSDSFKLSGLKGWDSFTATPPTDATYDSPNAGTTNSVTATLTDASFVPLSGTTLPENYNFPATATGEGRITPATPTMDVSGGTLAALGIDGPVAGRYTLTRPEYSEPVTVNIAFASADTNYADPAPTQIVIPVREPRYITGRIIDKAGVGVGGYRVRLLDVSNNQIVQETRSDSEGNYRIPCEPGSYKVLAGDEQVTVSNPA
jgi:hypothetical protein